MSKARTERGAARDAIADAAPAQARDEFTERIYAAFDEDDEVTDSGGALHVLRRGLAASPELRRGIRATIVFAIVAAGGKLAVPVLIQVILDRGVIGNADTARCSYRSRAGWRPCSPSACSRSAGSRTSGWCKQRSRRCAACGSGCSSTSTG
jgi:hypothetical protein